MINLKLIIRLALIGVALLLAGLFVGATNQFMPVAASAEARATDALFNVMIVIGTIIFLIVEGALLYSILRFRRKPNDLSDGPSWHGNTALEITWTAIPAIIVLGLAVYSYQVFAQTLKPVDGEMTIRVLGQQFAWSYDYSQFYPDKQMRPSDTLHVPVNTPIRMEIEAKDVMHGFWIPAFRIKQDAIPGRVEEVRFLPDLPGTYAVVCYELCGANHSSMQNKVIVEDQDSYDTFVKSLIILPPVRPLPGNYSAEWGRFLIVSNKYGCAACHHLDDAGINGVTGPSWNYIGDTAATREAGMDAHTYILHSILYPNEFVVPGYPAGVMPQNFSVLMDDVDLNSIVAYLESQHKNTATTQNTQSP